jgi:hypothetical protein
MLSNIIIWKPSRNHTTIGIVHNWERIAQEQRIAQKRGNVAIGTQRKTTKKK